MYFQTICLKNIWAEWEILLEELFFPLYWKGLRLEPLNSASFISMIPGLARIFRRVWNTENTYFSHLKTNDTTVKFDVLGCTRARSECCIVFPWFEYLLLHSRLQRMFLCLAASVSDTYMAATTAVSECFTTLLGEYYYLKHITGSWVPFFSTNELWQGFW